ncbi:hypothetical protein ACUOAQ_07145, partial [Escherichia sp. SP-MK]
MIAAENNAFACKPNYIGICSVCSAHPLVIEAALAFDRNST